MNKGFYHKLAANNIKKNKRVYIPYILAGIFTTMMYYMLNSISLNEGLDHMSGGASLKIILNLGCWVIGIFAVIFLFYTNRFLMKQRQKEIGLLNILGMNKGHIGKMLFCEALQIALIIIVGGLVGGLLLNRLMFLLLLKLLNFSVTLKSAIYGKALLSTICLFAAIFLVILASNLHQIHLTNPIDLLKGGQRGEREPKTKWLLALVGVICLGIGYTISIVTKSPLDAMMLFFVAVLLVIIGTYALFTAGSIAILKLLRKNPGYYYQTKHFISVSGMIYRMKQNAVGLANICILSTAVLVMISGTVSLYVGQEDALKTRYPREVQVTGYDINEEKKQIVNSVVEETLKDRQMEAVNPFTISMGSMVAYKEGSKFEITELQDFNSSQLKEICLIPLEEYNRLEHKEETLNPDEIMMYSKNGSGDSHITLEGDTFRVKKHLDHLFETEGTGDQELIEVYYLIFPDADAVRKQMQKQDFKEANLNGLMYNYGFDLKGNENEIRDFESDLKTRFEQNADQDLAVYVEGRLSGREDFYSVYGGLFFIGIFLGLVFLMATVLIIYYKQISEGYDDKERFAIMQKVGMSKKEIRSSIRSQVLTVFFLPLVMAVIHIAFAFPIVTRLMAIMNLTNVGLFAACTLGVIMVFGVLYGIVYGVTARTYYKIVE
ncbi:ABC transporter permease [Lactonifactor longoviformis]|uniref:Putative ABC transport system permease protein n=2 Tax=Lactonifactor TaxID=420345 RepID=A0A1M4SSC1_9CLOT|nr:FtsX-like permease family protein [Lactonifactor longoviformis]SHE35076.1 putative ABC transport system permease protein [Lactonifactor longoviformis DSM 17459]